MAIPFVAIEGYHTLLDSRAGKFVHEPTRHDPGWRALVDSTSIVGIAEVDQGLVTGVTLLVHHPEVRSAGTVILVPGSLQLDGAPLSGRTPAEAVDAVSAATRLAVARTEVLDRSGWEVVLGAETYLVESPDPVEDDAGRPLFAVGPVEVGATNIAPFLGRPAPGAPAVSVLPRRHILWNAMLASPPTTTVELAADLRAMGVGNSQVIDLPMTQLEPMALPDGDAIESLIRDVVAYPAGALPGDRLQVRILDRTGTADLEGVAAVLAATGIEVIEIGNAPVFDNGDTEIVAPVSLTDAEGMLPQVVGELSLLVGSASVVVDNESTDEFVVTVLVGRDFDLANLL